MDRVISVMGPKARELLAPHRSRRSVARALKGTHTREIDLAYARVRAARMGYIGGPGYELYVPMEMAGQYTMH